MAFDQMPTKWLITVDFGGNKKVHVETFTKENADWLAERLRLADYPFTLEEVSIIWTCDGKDRCRNN